MGVKNVQINDNSEYSGLLLTRHEIIPPCLIRPRKMTGDQYRNKTIIFFRGAYSFLARSVWEIASLSVGHLFNELENNCIRNVLIYLRLLV